MGQEAPCFRAIYSLYRVPGSELGVASPKRADPSSWAGSAGRVCFSFRFCSVRGVLGMLLPRGFVPSSCLWQVRIGDSPGQLFIMSSVRPRLMIRRQAYMSSRASLYKRISQIHSIEWLTYPLVPSWLS